MKRRPMRWIAKRLAIPCIAVGMLLVAATGCYTPWRKSQAEEEAIAQFAVLDESIHVPTDATLVAEAYFSERSSVHAFAGVERVYVTSRTCEEIITEYQQTMADSGWTLGAVGDCGGKVWLRMVTSRAGFGIYAEPPQGSRLVREWGLLRDTHENLYYVISSFGVEYER